MSSDPEFSRRTGFQPVVSAIAAQPESGDTPDACPTIVARRAIGWLAIVVGIVLGWIQSARSDDWMFRRSYYSHARQPGEEWLYPEPVSRSAYRKAYVGNGPGFAARGGWRYNTTVLRSGNSFDVQVNHEGWFELTP